MTDEQNTNGTATAVEEPPATQAGPVEVVAQDLPVNPPEAAPVAAAQPIQQRDARKPEVSYRCNTDRNTSVEASVWANQMAGPEGTWTQYSITVTRSYRDSNQQWCKGGSYRAHDVPVLLYLLQKAHNYCLDARTADSSMPF